MFEVELHPALAGLRGRRVARVVERLDQARTLVEDQLLAEGVVVTRLLRRTLCCGGVLDVHAVPVLAELYDAVVLSPVCLPLALAAARDAGLLLINEEASLDKALASTLAAASR